MLNIETKYIITLITTPLMITIITTLGIITITRAAAVSRSFAAKL